MAERSDLIVSLDKCGLWQACRQLRAWRDHGLDPLRLSVNLIARTWPAPTSSTACGRTLNDTGVAPRGPRARDHRPGGPRPVGPGHRRKTSSGSAASACGPPSTTSARATRHSIASARSRSAHSRSTSRSSRSWVRPTRRAASCRPSSAWPDASGCRAWPRAWRRCCRAGCSSSGESQGGTGLLLQPAPAPGRHRGDAGQPGTGRGPRVLRRAVQRKPGPQPARRLTRRRGPRAARQPLAECDRLLAPVSSRRSHPPFHEEGPIPSIHRVSDRAPLEQEEEASLHSGLLREMPGEAGVRRRGGRDGQRSKVRQGQVPRLRYGNEQDPGQKRLVRGDGGGQWSAARPPPCEPPPCAARPNHHP